MLYLLFLFADGLAYSYEELDLYDPEMMYIFTFAGGHLFVGYGESELVLTRDGAVVADYREKGLGPGEMDLPRVLFADEERMLVLTNNRHLVVFDRNLAPDASAYPPLPQELTVGIVNNAVDLGNGRFVFLEMPRSFSSANLMHLAVLENGEWRKIRSWLPHPRPAKLLAKNERYFLTRNRLIGRHYFAFRGGILLGEDNYEVHVHAPYDGSREPPLVQILSADVSELRGRIRPGLHCYVNAAYPYKDGYAVYISESLKESYYDYFTADGTFTRREKADYILVPVENGQGMWRANNREDRIYRLE